MTSIVSKVLAWLSPSHVAALNAAGHTLEADTVSLVAQVASALKDAIVATEGAAEKTTLGHAIVAACTALISSDLTNQQKFEQVVADALPLVLQVAAGGGVALVAADASTLTRTLVQNVYAAEVSTTAGAVAAKLAPLVGVTLPAA